MLSTFPATFPSPVGPPSPAFHPPWDGFFFSHQPSPSDHLSVDFLTSSPDSTSREAPATGSGSGGDDEDPHKPVSITEERKRKRKLSNRESARRSRMRKQEHLQNLRSDVTRLNAKNRELLNRLRVVNHFRLITMRNNDRLMAECSFLQRRLSQIDQIWKLQRLQINQLHGHANN